MIPFSSSSSAATDGTLTVTLSVEAEADADSYGTRDSLAMFSSGSLGKLIVGLGGEADTWRDDIWLPLTEEFAEWSASAADISGTTCEGIEERLTGLDGGDAS